MDERWRGNLFQRLEAADENDLVPAIAVFLEGTRIVKREEERSDCVDKYRGTRAAR